MSVNAFVHFTDWVIGHSHLAMLGFATFAAAGGLAHAWPHIPGARFNPKAMTWSYWLLFGGLTLMVVDLTIAGLIQGQLWQMGAPWTNTLEASRPYWIVRTISGVPIAAGFIAFLMGLTTGPRVPLVAEEMAA
jgi:cbb3-type cytochrome oxidase subunit 1